MNVKIVRRKSVFISMAFNRPAYVPIGLLERLCKERPYWRDLEKRLHTLPVIPKARLVGTEKGDAVANAIKFSEKHNLDLYYGYFITADLERTSIVPHAFCVFQDKVVEPNHGFSWTKPCYYVGFPVPLGDIASRKFETKFERMDYILKNLG